MIKNIVFDMGKVLLDYESMRACRHFLENEDDQKLVCSAVFDSHEWILLDMGLISEEEGLAKMCARLPERLQEAAKQCFAHWPGILHVEDRRHGDSGAGIKGKGIWSLYLFQRIDSSAIGLHGCDSGSGML